MPEDQPLIPVFIPPLANVLAWAEKQQGSPLSSSEVEAIRDKAACIMMTLTDARKMEESRGFVDVNPKNVWADWHRLRPQMVGGYLPQIILCVPGGDDLRERCEPILKAEGVEYEFRSHDDHMQQAFRASSMAWPVFTPEDFGRIDAHTTVVYALSKPVTPANARATGLAFLQLGKRLLDAGGIAIKSESSGISHSRERWTQFADSAAQDPSNEWSALFRAYTVYPVGSKTDLYSCGMHLLGAPDLIISPSIMQATTRAGQTDAAAAAQLFGIFATYLLAECPVGQFASGHTFSVAKDAPRYRLMWEPCTGYAEDSHFFNPFGRWRFGSI